MSMRRGGRSVRDWYARRAVQAARAARIASERAEVVRALAAEPWLCPECKTPSFSLPGDEIVLHHAENCPCYVHPGGYQARECEGYVGAVLVMAGLRPVFDGDYVLADRVTHRRVRAPA